MKMVVACVCLTERGTA